MADRGARYADKKITEVDRKLRQTYKTAEIELRKKLKDFNQKFAAKDREKRQQVQDGEISEQDYKDWLAGQVFQRKQFESKIQQVEEVMLNHNKYAMDIVNNSSFDTFAENYYAEAFKANWIVNDKVWSVYNTQALEQLIADDPQLLPEWKIDEKKDYKWNYQKVNNIVKQGIIQGEGVDEITDRLCKDLCTQNENRMRMFARTAITGAQSAGRQLQMEQAHDELGLEQLKQWLATHDSKTRDAHRQLDGQEVPYNKPFESELGTIRYPGDPEAEPGNVYNCRCTIVTIYPQYEERQKDWREDVTIDGQSYEEWKAHSKAQKTPYYPAADYPQITKAAQEQSELAKEVAKVINAKGYQGNVDKNYINDIMNSLTKSESEALRLVKDTYGNLTSIVWEEQQKDPNIPSHYDPKTGIITMFQKDIFGNEYSPKEQIAVFWHEYGHFLDDAKRSQSGFGYNTYNGYRLNGIHWEVNKNDAWMIAAQKDVSAFLQKMKVDSSYQCVYKPNTASAWIYKDGTAIDPRVFDSKTYDDLHGALSKFAHDFSEVDKANDYLYEQGLPRMPKESDYIEPYFTPKRGLYRRKEKFPGAEEAYRRACYEADQKQQEFWDTHDKDKLLEEQGRLLQRAERRKLGLQPATDTFDGSCSGFFRADMQIGGHSPDYYLRGHNGLQEGIANVFSSMMTRDYDTIEAMEKLCPNVYELIRRTIRRGK